MPVVCGPFKADTPLRHRPVCREGHLIGTCYPASWRVELTGHALNGQNPGPRIITRGGHGHQAIVIGPDRYSTSRLPADVAVVIRKHVVCAPNRMTDCGSKLIPIGRKHFRYVFQICRCTRLKPGCAQNDRTTGLPVLCDDRSKRRESEVYFDWRLASNKYFFRDAIDGLSCTESLVLRTSRVDFKHI